MVFSELFPLTEKLAPQTTGLDLALDICLCRASAELLTTYLFAWPPDEVIPRYPSESLEKLCQNRVDVLSTLGLAQDRSYNLRSVRVATRAEIILILSRRSM